MEARAGECHPVLVRVIFHASAGGLPWPDVDVPHSESAVPDLTCSRCGTTRAGFDRPPFPGVIGQRVLGEICQVCWGDWLKQQTMLINHYGLNVMDPQSRQFLVKNMGSFLFKTGDTAEIDTTKQGTITH